ncbi:sensor histidine kinase KdpD, partial [Pseudonocardia sp. KRD291]|uniref:sensor histidine kinase n=1 Tax=Pseudonocardia sp. KRD291 TaxID=2792007 RepID=UPI001C49DBEE
MTDGAETDAETDGVRPDEWPERTSEERTAVVLRLCVVGAATALLVADPGRAGDRLGTAAALVSASLVYALVLAVAAPARRRLPVPPALLTVVDGLLVLCACGLTGGVDSLLVTALPLVVIAASLRTGPVVGCLAAAGFGAGFTVAALLGSDPVVSIARRALTGLWWAGFLVATALLVGVLVRLLERQLRATAVSRARADTEHERYLSERALRDRLVSQGQARLDGARVVLHEFRTPVASLTALSADLAADRLSEESRCTATRLLADHAVHLRDMLDGLADLAVSDGSPLGRVRPRRVVLAELADGVLDAAAVAGHRRRAVVDPPEAAVRCDPQRLRRLLTNLAENAARHSADEPVELELRHADGVLVAEVRDRGPGLPDGQQGVVTAKGVALGERRGTAGLGLWIAEALATAM